MKFVVKDMDIATGGVQVVILNQEDAAVWDLHPMDRLAVRKGFRRTIAVLDIAESEKAVPRGQIGLFEEALDVLHAKDGDGIEISLAQKPESVAYIRSKLDGKSLTHKQICAIVNDIVDDKLTEIELTSYVIANYTHGMSMQETVDLTKAMTHRGQVIRFGKKPLVDLHSIGGVPGNRTTMIVVPILVAAGLHVPKTSSRAITSPAGTADTMEVLAPVTLSPARLKNILTNVGGFIVWGGAINLAPADDKIIKVEYPLSIDAEGQMLASIMAKKASVSATHLLMDLPVGPGAKIASEKQARHLAHRFVELGKHVGIAVKVMSTDGSEPIGNGIGPALEAKDCLWLLQGDPRGPQDLREKSIMMAAETLEFVRAAKKGKGRAMAEHLLDSGQAWNAMKAIIRAQGGHQFNAERLPRSRLSQDFVAQKNCVIRHLDNVGIAKVARLAGAPADSAAGLYIHKHKGQEVHKGDPIITVFSDSEPKLQFAMALLKQSKCVVVR